MSFRKEKKYKLNKIELKFLKFSLVEKGMKILYPKRVINSCYFDTNSLLMFNHSEEGILPRKKIRFRWYDNKTDFKKEIKISSIEGRYKTSSFLLKKNKKNLNEYNLFDKDYGIIYPKLLIKYQREYFIYKNLRLTFDSEIEYKKIGSIFERNIIDKYCVMEVKTSINTNEDYLEKIIGEQPNRFSKYCRGIKSYINYDI